MIALIGWLCAIIGVGFGAIGAYYTAAPDRSGRHRGFILWMINSPFLTISLIGISLGWFEPISAIILAPLNLYYFLTACRGYLNTRPDPLEGE